MIFKFEISGEFEAEDNDGALRQLDQFVTLIEGTGALTGTPQATANRASGEWARITPEGDFEGGGGGFGSGT
jgi:hypothetical protein